MHGNLLIVDDNERVFQSLAINFRRNGFDCLWAANQAVALETARAFPLSAAVIDLSLGSESGLDVMAELFQVQPELPVVFISGFGTLEAAVSAMKMGAFDFLPKPLNFKRLLEVVQNAMAAREEAARARSSRTTARLKSTSLPCPEFIHASPVVDKLLDQAARVADADIPVLITGESGTGKELLAEYVHAHSPRRDRPLVRVNCSAIADTLAESELFGHVKGAFTGAATDHHGFFEQADGGTLHLDEIGDMPLPTQAKILRTLENSLVRQVGGMRDIPVNVRVVASTNRDLQAMAANGQFRTDLFYRINALQLHIPPLRERREDIPPLLAHFLSPPPGGGDNGKRFSVAAEKKLLAYNWPGNTRELKNLVKVCALLAPGAIINVEDLPQSVKDFHGSREQAAGTAATPRSGRLDENEKSVIQEVLTEVGGNRRKAAEKLGISLRSLYYKLERYDLS